MASAWPDDDIVYFVRQWLLFVVVDYHPVAKTTEIEKVFLEADITLHLASSAHATLR